MKKKFRSCEPEYKAQHIEAFQPQLDSICLQFSMPFFLEEIWENKRALQ